jgi:1,4-alpha-glucan branching enzyme
MTGEEIEAIVGGYHGDAFRILGPHAVRRKGAQPKWEVRAFLRKPTGRILAGATRCDMVKKHAQGFFVAFWMANPAVHDHARLWDGREVEIDDPYRFGPLISDSDLYLHSEGTLYEAYRTWARTPWLLKASLAFALRYGRRMRRTSRWPASSTIGTSAGTPCAAATARSGNSSCPG